MEKNFYELIRSLSIIEVFKDLYPKNKIVEEINPNTGIKLYKTFSPFLKHNSKLEQLYFNEENPIAPGYFCFDSGKSGYIPNLLVEKFDDFREAHKKNYNLESKKSIEYLFKKLNLNLDKIDENTFIKNFEELYFEDFFDPQIQGESESLMANNSLPLKDGTWVNIWTFNWEGWESEY